MIVVSWNILADDYVKPGFYPTVRDVHLDPAWRRGRVIERIRTINADVFCLQECTPDVFAAIARPGYYAKKGNLKPDGVATFVRGPVSAVETLRFCDDTGHVALLVRAGATGVANVHVKWGGPAAAQARELLDALRRFPCDGWIVCGDFNAESESDALAAFRERGFVDAYANAPAPTCNSNRRTKRIDFILHSPALRSTPAPLPAIADDTPLPSETEPSDHLAISAEII